MGRKNFKVDVNPEVIRWARESAGYKAEEIAKKLRISKDAYMQIEKGVISPTFRQLELMSEYFKRPLSALLLSKPPDEKPITSSFRILPKSEEGFSKEFLLVLRKARYYQSIINELMKEMGIDPKPNVKSYSLEDDPRKTALQERESINISIQEQLSWENAYEAFNAWRRVIEAKNIIVMQMKFPIKEARGFVLMDKDPPFIVVNISDNILARIFTLFHEYAHILLGISEIYTEDVFVDPKVEKWCNVFASEFLLPKDILTKEFELKGEGVVEDISKKFKVSKKAVLTKLYLLRRIDESTYQTRVKKLEDTTSKIHIRPPLHKKRLQERGAKFLSLLFEAKERNLITTQDLLEYLDVNLESLYKIKKELQHYLI